MIILYSILSGVLYRLGGTNKGTKWRDLGCPSIGLIYMLSVNAQWYIHLLAFILFFAALTTYWDSIFKKDVFWLHALICGLAYLPYITVIDWEYILIRSVILAVSMAIWRKISKGAVAEEFGRGFLLIITLGGV